MSEITHFHLFCGLGGAARGGQHLEVSTGGMKARFRCLGGVDVQASVARAFSRYVGAPGTTLDLFSAEQFAAFHGQAPPIGWREATADDLRAAAGWEAPDVVVSSPPCKGLSSLVCDDKAGTGKYRALNALTVRGIALALEAWADDPPAFWLLENVPRLISRGADLLGQIVQMLEAAGYSVAYTVPDLGELGNLGQSRKRLHLVARHRERCPVHVFEPPKRGLRSVGDVLGPLPLPGDPAAGILHALPRLEWRTWVRLALIPAGGDWRDLQKLAVEDGVLRDFGLAPEVYWHHGVLGVTPWTEPVPTVTGRGGVTNGQHAVADPRPTYRHEYGQLGILDWQKPSGAVTVATGGPGGGPHSVADPRLAWKRQEGDSFANGGHYGVVPWSEPAGAVTAAGKHDNSPSSVADPRLPGIRHNNVYRVLDWREPSVAVTAGQGPSSGGIAVSDPRATGDWHNSSLGVAPWDSPAATVTASRGPGGGIRSISDPRYPWTGAHESKMRVADWSGPAKTITGSDRVGSGAPSVADPRATASFPTSLEVEKHAHLPELEARGVWVIRSLDDCWHRPMTVLERAALQGLLDPDTAGEFSAAVAGSTVSQVSEWVGNAIPPPAMAASLRAAGLAILLSRAGETFALSACPVWVRPFARALLLE